MAKGNNDLKSDVMFLEDDVESVTRERPLYATSDQHRLVEQFLQNYGIDTSDMDDEEVLNLYTRIQNLAEEQVQVLSRGAVNDTLDRLLREHVPPMFRGEFIHDSPTEIDRAKAMGWKPVVSEEANKESLTGTASNLVRCGDLVLMTMPVEQYAAMQIARDRRHAQRRARRKAEQDNPSQGALGFDPMGGRLGASPQYPIKPIKELGG